MQPNVSLRPYNTFGVEATARRWITIVNNQQLVDIYSQHVFALDFLVLGEGSNVLFVGDYEGTVIKMSTKGISHDVLQDHVLVTAEAGEVWNDLVWYCVNRGFPGIENLALIPGTVGAAPVQNIGAYGMELANVFHSCLVFDTRRGSFTVFHREDCLFSYRDSIFKSREKNRYVIAQVSLKLKLNATVNLSYGSIGEELRRREIVRPSIQDVVHAVSHIRLTKLPDPAKVGNAGSFFKNPILGKSKLQRLLTDHPEMAYYPFDEDRCKIAAGWLIERCGWRAKRQGDAGVWPHHALVLVNHGTASGMDIYLLSSQIVDSVQQTFRVRLEREVNVIGKTM